MTGTMLAAVFAAPGELALQRVPLPVITAPDQVIIKVEAAGLCGTDLQILKMPPGHPAAVGAILGHEFIGTVEQAGPLAPDLKPGDHVAADPNLTCGACLYCRRGLPNMCSSMTTLGIFLNGGFAEYCAAPARALYKISPRVRPESAVLIEPLACVVSAVEKAALQAGETAVVLGAGPIGLLFARLLAAAGAGRVIVSEPSAYRRACASRDEACLTADPAACDLVELTLSETGGLGADVVVDATGALFPQALALTCRGGRVLLFGQNDNACEPLRQNLITRREITVLGSYIARYSFPAAIEILERGVVNFAGLVTHRFPLEKIADGLVAMRAGEAIKVMITP